MTYYKLEDGTKFGMVVKTENKNQYEFVFGESVWQKTGILSLYFMEGNRYEEVTEEQAYEVIKRTSALYHKLETTSMDKLKVLNCAIPDIQTKNLKIRIIYLLYCINKTEKIDIDRLKDDGFTTRMVRGLKKLIDNGDMETDQQMENIVSNTYAMLAKYEDIMQNGKKSERDNTIIEEKIKHDKLVRESAVL